MYGGYERRDMTDFSPTSRATLSLAAAHIEMAMAHINNAAQGQMPVTPNEGDDPHVEELRLMVRALSDVRDRLKELARE